MKKEREIIEMIEKEEKSRDNREYCYPPTYLSDRDSEVLKVEHELLQLEKEQLKHQHDSFLYQSRIRNNRRSLEDLCDSCETDGTNYRKSMPELQLCKSMPNVPKADQYRKSMPDIQQAYYKSTAVPENHLDVPLHHRKSLPELKTEFQKSAFYSPQICRQPILPDKPLRPLRSR